MTIATNPRRTILLIEHDISRRRLLVTLLTDAGYGVLQATNGGTAFRLALEHRPSLILLELMPPAATAPEILAQLRADERTRYIPLVMMTGQHPTAAPPRASPPDGMLHLPFDIGAVLAHIDRMMALGEVQHIAR